MCDKMAISTYIIFFEHFCHHRSHAAIVQTRSHCINSAAIIFTSQPLFMIEWVIVCECKESAWHTAWPSMWSSLCAKTMIQ